MSATTGTRPMLAPATAAEVAAIVRDAAAAGRALRICGAGRWLDAGHPVTADADLSLAGLRGITRYTPEDLTLTCGAGTTLAELEAATRPHGQWCPLLPWGDDAGTVGATIATATCGPFAGRLGRPRELVLGVECVDGLGRLIAAGARVVKNVAGFDLTRAVTGSWGTVAVVTQLHLRLRARPTVDQTFALTVRAGADPLLAEYVRGPLAPLACVALSDADARALEAGEARHLVRIGGNAAFVAAARDALAGIGAVRALDATAWDVVRARLAPAARAGQWRWDPLSLRLRERFDPRRILNPGLLGDPA